MITLLVDMNKMMKWWAWDAIAATYRVLFPAHRRGWIAFGWFFLFAFLAYWFVKWCLWFYVAMFCITANVVQIVVGLVLWPFALLARPLGRKWGKLVAWYRGPLTTAEVEHYYSYYARPGTS